ncbi:2197_t:CDS:2 [Entrophospora sp. SA101]|nr:2197_t:CDS:2 [Entrophospora sp. SA101]
MDQYINRKSVLKFKASLKKTFNSKTSKLQGFIVLFYILVVFVGLVSRLEETYYQSKNNVFNRIFAKNGWFWTTVVYGAYLAMNENERQGEKLGFSILRYIASTGYWYIITQKTLFGPSVFDMIFTMSGGNCRFNEDTENFSNYGKTNDINSSYQCKQLKGEWINGHDASGHCFLLVHSSLFLLEEICGSFNKKKILELNDNIFPQY